jgi:hypothetical protein
MIGYYRGERWGLSGAIKETDQSGRTSGTAWAFGDHLSLAI